MSVNEGEVGGGGGIAAYADGVRSGAPLGREASRFLPVQEERRIAASVDAARHPHPNPLPEGEGVEWWARRPLSPVGAQPTRPQGCGSR